MTYMKTSKTALNLTEGRPIKLILRFAIPVFLGNLFQICYSLVDTKIVGSILGEEALAAVGSVSILHTLLTGFFNGLSLGFSVITARFYGSGEERKLKENVAGAILLGYLTAAVIITIVAVFLRPILTLLNVPPQQLDMSLSYITLLVWGMFVTLAYNLCANTLRAIGDSITPLIFLVIAALTNVALDYLFILVFGLGVRGAAVATMLSQLLSVVLCLNRIRQGFPILHLAREHFVLSKKQAVMLYESGLSMGLMSSLVNFGSLVLQSGINQQNYGAGRYDRIRQGMKSVLILGAVWDGIVFVLAHTISPYLIRFLTSSDNEEIIYWGTTYLKVDMSFLLVCLFIVILRNCMQGFGDPRTPILSSFIELVGKLVFTFVFVRLFGYWGIIWTEPVIWFLMVIPLIVMTLRNPVIRKRQPE